ncbi:MAG TPA: ROK family protein, partial [Bacilli bacterium]|nr:ROK family protein [Bacilli bacterium]
MKKAILAVDAGGTKTKVAIIDDNKDICYQKIGGSGSPAVNGIKAIEYIISLIKEVYKEVKSIYQIEYIQMGISGLGTVANKHQFEQQLSNELQIPVSMENDVVLALYSV